MTQRFVNGEIVTTYDDNDELRTEDFQSLSLLPYDYFIRAELLQSKSCSFDDYSNFYAFVAKRFTDGFNKSGMELTRQLNFSYEVEVKKTGLANIRSLKLTTDSSNEDYLNILNRIAKSIDFYFPTYQQDQPQEDTIRVTGSLSVDNDGKVYAHSIKMERQIDNSSK